MEEEELVLVTHPPIYTKLFNRVSQKLSPRYNKKSGVAISGNKESANLIPLTFSN